MLLAFTTNRRKEGSGDENVRIAKSFSQSEQVHHIATGVKQSVAINFNLLPIISTQKWLSGVERWNYFAWPNDVQNDVLCGFNLDYENIAARSELKSLYSGRQSCKCVFIF